MAAPPIPPIRLELIGTGLAVEKLHWPALRELAERYVVTTFTDSSAKRSGRFGDYSGVGPARAAAVLVLAAGHPDRDGWFTGVGVHHVVRIRLLCGDIARVHGAVQTDSTIAAPSDFTLNLVFTGGAIGDYTASYPEIPVPPNDVRSYGTEGVLAGYSTVFLGIDDGYRAELVDFADAVQYSVRLVGSVVQSVANAMVVQRALDSAERAADLALHPAPGAGLVRLWRPRGSTGLFDGLPGQRISSSASFVA